MPTRAKPRPPPPQRTRELAASLPLVGPARRRAGHARADRAAARPGGRARRAGPSGTRTPAASSPPSAPPEVNPSLWRQARLNAEHGLFEVRDGVYQVRGADVSNITFVAGENGWIVVDALTTAETARAALALVTEHLGERPVSAVIYTHSHIDHFGGLRGIASDGGPGGRPADHRARRLPRRRRERERDRRAGHGPAGRVHVRRPLPRGPRGHVDAGIGVTVPHRHAGSGGAHRVDRRDGHRARDRRPARSSSSSRRTPRRRPR